MAAASSDPIYFYSKSADFFELSNFSPHGFALDGAFWPTVEHYFQAQKFPDCPDYQERIRRAHGPKQAKSLGRSRKVPIRPDWEACKESIMARALRAKFTTHRGLRELLVGTGERPLIEQAPSDYYWGCGRTGTGRNRLGELLMALRDQLRREAALAGERD